MKHLSLTDLLMQETEAEKAYKKNKGIQHPVIQDDGIAKVTEEDYPFFEKSNLYVGKHDRYSPIIRHRHAFVEMNYMYKGNCYQMINGNQILLKEGQLLLMDRDTVHSIEPLEQNDLLINLLIQNDSINTSILKNMVESNSLVYSFLVDASSDSSHDHYLILETDHNPGVINILNHILEEYYFSDNYSLLYIQHLLPLLFIELSRQLENQIINHSFYEQDILDMIQYIDDHYSEIDLPKLSEHFGYNKNYASDKLKKATGYSFNDLLNRKRLAMFTHYLKEKSYSIEEIAYMLGYESPSALYKICKKYYGLTPNQYKKKLLS